jgi:hypothetical protein
MIRKTTKHVARNKKKYWRKFAAKHIEDQLEDVRVREIPRDVIFNSKSEPNDERRF